MVLLSIGVQAQAGYQLKVFAGLEQTQPFTKQKQQTPPFSTPVLGLIADFKIAKRLHVEAMLSYSASARRLPKALIASNSKMLTKWPPENSTLWNTIRLPVAATYHFKDRNAIYLGAGAGLSYQLTTNTRNKPRLSNGTYFNDFDFQDGEKRAVVPFGQLMVGKDLQLGRLKGGFRLQYNLDANRWSKLSSKDVIHNSRGTLGINIILELGNKSSKSKDFE